MENQRNISNREIENFWLDNSQNREEDALLLSVLEPEVASVCVLDDFLSNNTQNRAEDALLLSVNNPDMEFFSSDNTQNRETEVLESPTVHNFFIDNTQNRNEDVMLITVDNFHVDCDGDDVLNRSYDDYVANLNSSINADHSYTNRVSDECKLIYFQVGQFILKKNKIIRN